MTTGQEASVVLTNPTRSPFGTASLDLNAARTQLSFTAVINGIDFNGSQTTGGSDNLVNAHIHVGAPPGANAGVSWGFFGNPFNDANSSSGANCIAFLVGVGGTCSVTWDLNEGNGATNTLALRLPEILNNLSYINFHTVENGGVRSGDRSSTRRCRSPHRSFW